MFAAVSAARSNSGAHDSWAMKPNHRTPTPRETRNPASRRDFALRVARPGLEPGTPRFSVVRSGLTGGAQSLEIKRFSPDESSKQKSAIYELLHAVQEMEASHLLFRRRLERRGRRCLDEAALMSCTRTRSDALAVSRRYSSVEAGICRMGAVTLPSRAQGGRGRRGARVAEARWNPDGTRAPDVVPDV
jgi:hypothetical protein